MNETYKLAVKFAIKNARAENVTVLRSGIEAANEGPLVFEYQRRADIIPEDV